MYAQMLVGMVAMTGQWWQDSRQPDKRAVAAHLVNLAWNGLTGLKKEPELRSEPSSRPSPSARGHLRGAAALRRRLARRSLPNTRKLASGPSGRRTQKGPCGR